MLCWVKNAGQERPKIPGNASEREHKMPDSVSTKTQRIHLKAHMTGAGLKHAHRLCF